MERKTIRLAIPSKGRLAEPALNLLAAAGLPVVKENPRQYFAVITNLPGTEVVFQRTGDIVTGVRDGTLDFGVTGVDVLAERDGENGRLIAIHPSLGFGACTLEVIVPEAWLHVDSVANLATFTARLGRPLRVATKYPCLAERFFSQQNIKPIELIATEGTLETAPAIGYADMIVDLVSTGTTLRDNRLKPIAGGQILASQACLIANRDSLQTNPHVLEAARTLLEYLVSYLRARENVAVFVNMRGESPEEIARRMFAASGLQGLQGPTLSPVFTPQGERWYAAHLIVPKEGLQDAITSLRTIGGSGVVVTPVSYIFEEEPAEVRNMLAMLDIQEAPC